jgi:hypothetical protein
MSDELRAQLTTLITTLPSWYSASDRVRYAIFEIITAPEFVIQK